MKRKNKIITYELESAITVVIGYDESPDPIFTLKNDYDTVFSKGEFLDFINELKDIVEHEEDA